MFYEIHFYNVTIPFNIKSNLARDVNNEYDI